MFDVLSVSDVIKEYEKKSRFRRRTPKSLAVALGVSENVVHSVMKVNSDIFKKVRGCKGEMFEKIS